MTIQPQQPAATAPPGWYPNGNTLRYWDGAAWTANVAPLPPQAVVVHRPAYAARPQHVSGLTTGQHILWAIITVCTLGLALPFWLLAWALGRRRIR